MVARATRTSARSIPSSCKCGRRSAQYLQKISGIIPQLHYPEGSSNDRNGAVRPNEWLAREILNQVAKGKGVMFPNAFASMSNKDLLAALKTAGLSSWQLSTLDIGGADYAPGMKAILQWYEAVMFQGWLRRAARVSNQSTDRARTPRNTRTPAYWTAKRSTAKSR